MIEDDPAHGADVLRNFRRDLLELSLDDAPVEALLGWGRSGGKKPKIVRGEAESG